MLGFSYTKYVKANSNRMVNVGVSLTHFCSLSGVSEAKRYVKDTLDLKSNCIYDEKWCVINVVVYVHFIANILQT